MTGATHVDESLGGDDLLAKVPKIVISVFAGHCLNAKRFEEEMVKTFNTTEDVVAVALCVAESMIGLFSTIAASIAQDANRQSDCFQLVSEDGVFERLVIVALEFRIKFRPGYAISYTDLASELHQKIKTVELSTETWHIKSGKGKSLYLEIEKNGTRESLPSRQRARAIVTVFGK